MDEEHSAKVGGKILLVEDEDSVRLVVQRMLVSLGYEAVTAADAHTALEMVAEDPEINLVLTDIVLPFAKSGLQLGVELARHRPSLPVIYISGYSRDAMKAIDTEGLNVPVLSKPFRRARLAQVLEEALG